MSDKCTCPSFTKNGTQFSYIRDPDCPIHGDGKGILRDMRDEKQAEIERLRAELEYLREAACEVHNITADSPDDAQIIEAMYEDKDLKEKAEAELARVLQEFGEFADEAMRNEASFIEDDDGDKAGWWDSCSMSGVRDLGDKLVELGLWERHADGYGRRWFYRPKAALEEKP